MSQISQATTLTLREFTIIFKIQNLAMLKMVQKL